MSNIQDTQPAPPLSIPPAYTDVRGAVADAKSSAVSSGTGFSPFEANEVNRTVSSFYVYYDETEEKYVFHEPKIIIGSSELTLPEYELSEGTWYCVVSAETTTTGETTEYTYSAEIKNEIPTETSGSIYCVVPLCNITDDGVTQFHTGVIHLPEKLEGSTGGEGGGESTGGSLTHVCGAYSNIQFVQGTDETGAPYVKVDVFYV